MDELRYRAERRLRCDAFQASLRCPTDRERRVLAWALAAWKAGELSLNDTQHIVTTLRRQAA